MRFMGTVIAMCLGLVLFSGVALAQETNLLALGEGTLLVVGPQSSYPGWGPVNILDDLPGSAFANADGRPDNKVFVFEMLEAATIEAFEFDCTGLDRPGRGAKDITVEVSAGSQDAGFEKVMQASLAEGKAGQRFEAAKKIAGRWVRLTLINNHGDPKYIELGGFRGYGLKPDGPPAAIGPITGTYSTNYKDFHLLQQGTAISGCYEHKKGLFEGMIEGRIAKIVWNEDGGNSHGPAMFVFAPDGKSFRGYWWRDSDKGRKVDGEWTGKRIKEETGSCPHWSGSVGGELQKELATNGRARLYGILFDTDSARIRAESFPTLDEVVRVLAGETSWSLTIEGHTDSTGTPAHNQTLSEQRAKSVQEYLAGKGIAAGRLTTMGFGQTKPVADNDTELGRAQNRRVELVKK